MSTVAPPTTMTPVRRSVILAVSVRAMLPVIALAAIIITLQGHNKPGGGFIGGLVFSAGLILNALTFGPDAARRALRVDPVGLAMCGLLLALISGLFSPAGGFLHGVWTKVTIPLLGELKIGTPIFFDLGVFLVVVGSATLMLLCLLERESEPGHSPAAGGVRAPATAREGGAP